MPTKRWFLLLVVGACNGTEPLATDSIEAEVQCCTPTCQSPILVDVGGNGIRLTSSSDGVLFDIRTAGLKDQVAWTEADSDDAWLALDRNRDGFISNGAELFGNFVDPVTLEERNGFDALALLDSNADGKISSGDEMFGRLRLWQDRDHDGVSLPSEMFTLAELSITSINLDVRASNRTDRYGNQLRYRAKVESNSRTGVYAYDVYLVLEPMSYATNAKPTGQITRASCTTAACAAKCNSTPVPGIEPPPTCGWFDGIGGGPTETNACYNSIQNCLNGIPLDCNYVMGSAYCYNCSSNL